MLEHCIMFHLIFLTYAKFYLSEPTDFILETLVNKLGDIHVKGYIQRVCTIQIRRQTHAIQFNLYLSHNLPCYYLDSGLNCLVH